MKEADRSTVGLLIIGDEILSGKREDKHFRQVVAMLAARGIPLGWAQVLGDDATVIAEALRTARARGDIVLSCGGIGATPDDQTRQAAALAFGRDLARHAEAVAIMIEHYGAEQATPNRLRMAEFPQGAALIPNPVNHIAGFSIEHCYFVPGFPEMAWPMLEWVIDGPLASLHDVEPPVERRLIVRGTTGESDLLDIMERLLTDFPGIRLSSLPTRGTREQRRIEFGVKGRAAQADAAFAQLYRDLIARGDLDVERVD